MEFLFGEGQYGVRILVAVFLVLALIGVLAWFVRVFRSERTGAASRRGRQPPRLAVIDAAAVDERRRLVLIRRDNVEHLLMIGGRADIVVEPNIVRAAALARPPALAEHQATQLEAAPTVFTPPRPQQEPVSQHTEADHNSAEAAQRLVEAVLLRRNQARFGESDSRPEADAERGLTRDAATYRQR